MKMHSGDKPNKCDICNFSFMQAGNLKSHMRIHTRENMPSPQAGNLKKHKQRPNSKIPNKCSQCDFASSEANLRKHMKVHTVVKPNKCEKCGYKSTHLYNLKRHSKVHSGEKTNVCTQCDHAFPAASNMRRHYMNVHRKDNPLQVNTIG